jgi:outer membrane protein TolC
MKKNHLSSMTAATMAFLLAASAPFQVFAEEANPDSSYSVDQERLTDNQLDYDEIGARVKEYYGPIKSAYNMVRGMTEDQGQIAVNERTMADDLISQARAAEDLAKDQTGMDQMINKATAKALRKTANQMRTMANNMDRSLSRKTSSEKQIDRQANSLILNVEMMLNQYQQLQSQRTIAAKGVELATAAKQLQNTMQAQGMAVDADVLSAAASLSSGQSQLNTLDAGIEQICKMLCSFTGYDEASNPVFGEVPAADPSYIATVNVAEDKEKAVNNNYELISLRGQTGGGMTDLQIRTSKTTTQIANKLRNVEYSEENVRSNIQALYDAMEEKNSSYSAAKTAYESGQISWQAAQVQKANGMLSNIQYMQQELAWLQAQSGYKCADLALQQAIQNYKWAVAGASVSADTQ